MDATVSLIPLTPSLAAMFRFDSRKGYFTISRMPHATFRLAVRSLASGAPTAIHHQWSNVARGCSGL